MKKIAEKLRAGIAKIAAIGAVRRSGVGALQAYGGQISGKGSVTRNSGPDKGKKINFELSGKPGARPRP